MRRRAIIASLSIVAGVAIIYPTKRNEGNPPARSDIAGIESPGDRSSARETSESDIDNLSRLLKDNPQEALKRIAALEDTAKNNPNPPLPTPPEIERLSAAEKETLANEVQGLFATFAQIERTTSKVLFDGERGGTKIRTVRISAPGQEQFEAMTKAYSDALRRYPDDSPLHAALRLRVDELVNAFSQDRKLTCTWGSEGMCQLTETTGAYFQSDQGGSESQNDGIPDENGRLSFLGPHKITIHHSQTPSPSPSAKDSRVPSSLQRYAHLLE